MADKVQEAEQKKRAPRGSKGTKPKVVDRDGDRGTWFPCKPEEGPLKLVLDEGFLKEELLTFNEGETVPAPPEGSTILCRAWVERGLSLPPSKFFLAVLKLYGLQPHNICPNSYTILANFQIVCEGYLGVELDIRLFQWFYQCRALYFEEGETCNYGSATFVF